MLSRIFQLLLVVGLVKPVFLDNQSSGDPHPMTCAMSPTQVRGRRSLERYVVLLQTGAARSRTGRLSGKPLR